MIQKSNSNGAKLSLEKYKRTKIIATIGPSTNSYDKIYALIKAGANGLRLNFSHGTHQEKKQQIEWIRKASKELGKPVSIIQDLQGPKIRLGDFDGAIEVGKGQSLRLGYNTDYLDSGIIPIQYDFSSKVKRGDRVYLFDGQIQAVVSSVSNKIIHLTAENSGILVKRKGINLPDTDFEGDVITAKDRADLIFGSSSDIDYVAQSFVQTSNDVKQLKKIISSTGMSAGIIVKVETKAAIENMEEIIAEADAVMVARGDLAYEVRPEAVPIIQEQLLATGKKLSKPVIIATQMLYSLTSNLEPTRAEVSDIANSVIQGADCLMLSDETASGNNPIEATEVMKKVIIYTEENASLVSIATSTDTSKQEAISLAIVKLAESIEANAIIAETKSGATAKNIAAKHTKVPLIAVTNLIKTAQQLAIVYGVKSYVRSINKQAAQNLTDWLLRQKILNKGDIVVSASGKHPGVVGTTDTIKVRIVS